MNSFLRDIFDQPKELEIVLNTLLGDELPKVKQIAGMLAIADEIVLTSMGSAYYSLMPMYDALLKKKKRVILIESAELLYSPELLNKNALYVIMSRSGESGEIAELSYRLRNEHCMTIGITMTPDSTLAKNVSVVLNDPASYDALICTKAYSSLALSGLLCVSMMNHSTFDEREEGCIRNMFAWMNANKVAILRSMESISFLNNVPNIYFLSRGYGLGVVRSASLWLEEAARICGNVLSLDNFYHGPIELSRTATVPVLLDVKADDRSRMIWNTINSYAEKSIYIGPESEAGAGSFCLHYPDFEVEDGYRMILLALYFQLFAYQCAIVHGIEPGKLETVSWVVK